MLRTFRLPAFAKATARQALRASPLNTLPLRSAFCIKRSAFGVLRSAFCVQPLPGDGDQEIVQTGFVTGQSQFFAQAVAAGFHAPDGDAHEVGNFLSG